jgi:hypothetical protein
MTESEAALVYTDAETNGHLRRSLDKAKLILLCYGRGGATDFYVFCVEFEGIDEGAYTRIFSDIALNASYAAIAQTDRKDRRSPLSIDLLSFWSANFRNCSSR